MYFKIYQPNFIKISILHNLLLKILKMIIDEKNIDNKLESNFNTKISVDIFYNV